MAAAAQTERFETLYRRYQRPVLAYALRRADRAEALDVAADTFLVAWRRIDDVPDGEAALYWLYGELQRHTAEIVETDEPLSPYASSGPYRGSVSVIGFADTHWRRWKAAGSAAHDIIRPDARAHHVERIVREDEEERWHLAKTYRNSAVKRFFTGLVMRQINRNRGRRDWHVLTTTGRQSGSPRKVPVSILEHDGVDYLVAAYAVVGWVHNVRADPSVTIERGDNTDSMTAVELTPEEAAPVLEAYYRAFGKFVAAYWDVPRDGATTDDFVATAATHPAFRLVPAD